MSEAPSNDRLVLTTETRQALGQRVLMFLFFGGLAAAFSIFLQFGAVRPIDGYFVLNLAALQLIIVSLPVFIMLVPPRGIWILDSNALIYEPRWRRHRIVRWNAVDRVKWWHVAAVVNSGSVTIPLPWHMFDEDLRLAAQLYVEAKLSPDFDLKEVVLPRHGNRLHNRSAVQVGMDLAKLLGIGLAFLSPWLAVVLIAICFASARSILWPAVGYVFFVTLGAAFAYCFVLIAKDERAFRHIHPKWPWRLPRSKTLALRKVAGDPWLDAS
jgi:hypothetical protein